MSRPFLFVILTVAGLAWPVFSVAQSEAAGPLLRQRDAHSIMPIPRPPRPPGDGWVWVPPVYRTVLERVWREPIYRTITEQVWVPDEYGWRDADCWEDGAYVRRQVWTLIRPGYYTTQTRRILISPGGWIERPRRELVTPGHWEQRGAPTPPPIPWPQPQPPHTPTPRPPGLEPFSPLWEWPDDKPAK
jgi:hypothetical protein